MRMNLTHSIPNTAGVAEPATPGTLYPKPLPRTARGGRPLAPRPPGVSGDSVTCQFSGLPVEGFQGNGGGLGAHAAAAAMSRTEGK
jgi:hypothetical protein